MILRCDNQTDSFILAIDAATGETRWKTERDELPSWGTPTVAVTADGRLYLSSEDGDIIVVEAGPAFRHVATNPMGEQLMATPALSQGVMYVRSPSSPFAVGAAR